MSEEVEYDVHGNPIKKKPKMDIKVSVDSKQMEQLIKEKAQLEEELESERIEREDLEIKLKIVAEQKLAEKKKQLGAPDYIETPEELKRWAESEGKIPKAGSGQVPLSSAQTGKGDDLEFESHEDLVAWLREVSELGTSKEKRQAKMVIDKLWEKQIRALKEDEMPRKVYEDNPKESGESIIMKTIRKKNELIRKKRLGEKEA